MEKKRQKEILILATKAGKIMMKSGAEIYRVEDTISRICEACGVDHINVFAMPTGIPLHSATNAVPISGSNS